MRILIEVFLVLFALLVGFIIGFLYDAIIYLGVEQGIIGKAEEDINFIYYIYRKIL